MNNKDLNSSERFGHWFEQNKVVCFYAFVTITFVSSLNIGIMLCSDVRSLFCHWIGIAFNCLFSDYLLSAYSMPEAFKGAWDT